MYVGVTGTFASGKGEIARILRQKGFIHYGFGELLRDELRKAGIEPTVPNTSKYANEQRAIHGPDHFARILLHKIENEAPKNAVLESIRTLGELQMLRKLPGFLLISVDAPREERFKRLMARARHDGMETFEQFCEWEDKQLEGKAHEQQLLAVMDEADIKIVNIGNLDELREQISEELNI